jgi:hypothetical protein
MLNCGVKSLWSNGSVFSGEDVMLTFRSRCGSKVKVRVVPCQSAPSLPLKNRVPFKVPNNKPQLPVSS